MSSQWFQSSEENHWEFLNLPECNGPKAAVIFTFCLAIMIKNITPAVFFFFNLYYMPNVSQLVEKISSDSSSVTGSNDGDTMFGVKSPHDGGFSKVCVGLVRVRSDWNWCLKTPKSHKNMDKLTNSGSGEQTTPLFCKVKESAAL